MGRDGCERRALLLGQLLAEQQFGEGSDPAAGPDAGLLLGTYDPDLGRAIDEEVSAVFADERVRAALPDAGADDLGRVIGEQLTGPLAHEREALWALLGGADRELDEPSAVSGAGPAGTGPPRTWLGRHLTAQPRGWLDRRRTWLVRQGAAALMNLMIGAALTTVWVLHWLLDDTPPQAPLSALALKVFAVWSLAFLPCWLYVRFLGQRAGALWAEYVLNLHRLGWDQPQYLPRPPRSSQFYPEWVEAGGRTQQQETNIYRQKFNAYYGRSVAESARSAEFRVSLDTLFPVFLTAAVLAVCWTAVLWDDQFLRDPQDVWDVLKYAFLGAYVFIVQTLVRRFFASDLRSSAYTSALLRISVVLISMAALYQVLEIWLAGNPDARRWECAVAFMIGFFPLVATQVVVRAAAVPLRMSARSLDSDYPLNQLDGLNIWYESRLVEENIDDMQNLSTANFVDVILHTRVPVARLVDWVDQSFLFLHLDRVERSIREQRRARRLNRHPDPDSAAAPPAALTGRSAGPGNRAGTQTRTVLRQLGIRAATDLIKAFPRDVVDPPPGRSDPAAREELLKTLDDAGLPRRQIITLVRVLSEEQGLAPVWNWHDRGVIARCAGRRPRPAGAGAGARSRRRSRRRSRCGSRPGRRGRDAAAGIMTPRTRAEGCQWPTATGRCRCRPGTSPWASSGSARRCGGPGRSSPRSWRPTSGIWRRSASTVRPASSAWTTAAGTSSTSSRATCPGRRRSRGPARTRWSPASAGWSAGCTTPRRAGRRHRAWTGSAGTPRSSCRPTWSTWSASPSWSRTATSPRRTRSSGPASRSRWSTSTWPGRPAGCSTCSPPRCGGCRCSTPADRAPAHAGVDVPARLRLLLDAYGLPPAGRAELLDLADRSWRRSWHAMRWNAEHRGGGWARMWAEGVGDVIERRRAWFAAERAALASAL